MAKVCRREEEREKEGEREMIDIYIYTERERRGKTIRYKLRVIHVMKKILY